MLHVAILYAYEQGAAEKQPQISSINTNSYNVVAFHLLILFIEYFNMNAVLHGSPEI